MISTKRTKRDDRAARLDRHYINNLLVLPTYDRDCVAPAVNRRPVMAIAKSAERVKLRFLVGFVGLAAPL
jgi:hypothetical protein